MKKIYTLVCCFLTTITFAQSVVSSFEAFSLSIDSFANGELQSNNPTWRGFANGNALFENDYDTSFGGFWSNGFALSTMRDSVTNGFTNLYSAVTASGYMSLTYAIGQKNAWIYNNDSNEQLAEGVYVTNSTYASLSMKNGDTFAKKFGGASGNDSDFFVMYFVGYFDGSKSDTVSFYLADYRFSNNNEDYILTNWEWVDLTSIGKFDSIQILLASSDNGQFGMNTPAFYAIDDFTMMREPFTALKQVNNSSSTLPIYPNPASNILFIESPSAENITITDMQGKIVLSTTSSTIDISSLNPGIYFIQALVNSQNFNTKFLKI